jgi:hypothetical protein
MTAVLTVMSSMDPHTIRETIGWFGCVVGSLSLLSFRSNYYSGLCGRFDVSFGGAELLP